MDAIGLKDSEDLLAPAVRKCVEVADAARADVERLQRELTEAREEREKFRYCARVMCGAHIGQPQPACPVCERNALRARLAAAEALLLFLSRQDTMPPGFVQMIDGFLAQRPAAGEQGT